MGVYLFSIDYLFMSRVFQVLNEDPVFIDTFGLMSFYENIGEKVIVCPSDENLLINSCYTKNERC